MKNTNFILMTSFVFSLILISSSIQYSLADTGVVSMDSHDVKYDINNAKIESIFPADLKARLRRTHVPALLLSRRRGTVSVAGLAPSIFQARDLDQ